MDLKPLDIDILGVFDGTYPSSPSSSMPNPFGHLLASHQIQEQTLVGSDVFHGSSPTGLTPSATLARARADSQLDAPKLFRRHAPRISMRQRFLRRLDDFATKFTMPKKVVVRSTNLRLMELALVLVTCATIFMNRIVWHLDFLSHEDLQIKPLLDVFMPDDGFMDCSMAHSPCGGMLPMKSSLSYCGLPNKTCKLFDVLDATEKIGNNGIFIATSIHQVHEFLCKDSSHCKRPRWLRNQTTEREDYVQGVEAFVMRLRHHFTRLDFEVSLQNAQGFLHWQNETTGRRLPCRGFPQGCPYDEAYWKRSSPAECSRTDEQRCYSGPSGDYVSVSTLLNAANVSLDGVAWSGLGVYWRDVGIPLRVEVSLTNLETEHFWHWPWGRHWCYRLKPTHVSFGPKDEFVKREVRWISGDKRVVLTKKGIYIIVASEGHTGKLRFVEFLTKLVVSLSVLRYTKAFIIHVLIHVFSLFRKSKYTSLLFEYAWLDETPDENELRQELQSPRGSSTKGLMAMLRSTARKKRALRFAAIMHGACPLFQRLSRC